MNELELAVRTIDGNLEQLPTKSLHKWRSILETTIAKIDRELDSGQMHTCGVCGFEEYGFRTELPVAWREKGDLVICFQHEDKDIAEQLEKALKKDSKQKEAEAEASLEELMNLL